MMQIAPMPRSPVRPPPSIVRKALPQAAVGSESFGQGPMRRANRRRRTPEREARGAARTEAPLPEPEVQDAAPFMAQLLAQDLPEEKPADPFETASQAYEKVAEDPFEKVEEEVLDAVLADPKIHIDVKI